MPLQNVNKHCDKCKFSSPYIDEDGNQYIMTLTCNFSQKKVSMFKPIPKWCHLHGHDPIYKSSIHLIDDF